MKKFMTLFSLIILLSSSIMASTPSYIDGKTPTSLQEQLHEYLDNIDLKDIEEVEKVYIDFMINPKGEILVLSTNNDILDRKIKQRLNYKKVYNHQLNYNEVYTLPVSFEYKK